MALGGFLAGLAQSSKQWPGAIQNRMLLQQQAEERAQDIARQQQEDIITRLGFTSGAGEVGATKAIGANLSPANAPILNAFITQAVQNNEENAIAMDMARYERDLKELERNKQLAGGDWKPGPNGSFYRNKWVDNEVVREETDAPPKPVSVNEVYPKIGKILVNDPSDPNGFRWVDMDPSLKDVFEKYRTDDAHVVSVNWDFGLIAMSDKQILQMSPEDLNFAFGNIQRSINLKFEDFTNREDYRLVKKVELLTERFALEENRDERRQLIENAKNQKSFADGVFKDQIDSLQSGALNPEQAFNNANTRLMMYQMDPKEQQRLLELWEPQFNLFKYNYKLDAKLRSDLDIGRRLMVTARNLDSLLKDPEVQKRVGPIKGNVEDFKLAITGGRNLPQAYVDFMFELDNMRDIVQRGRSGAAIPAHEVSFYKNLLGAKVADWRNLKGRMATIIKYENRKAYSIHSNAWTLYHKQELSKEESDQLRRDLLFDAGSIFHGDPDTPINGEATDGAYYGVD